MPGQGWSQAPLGSPRPFGISHAEVKPEPRLGAGLAPAQTGLACAFTPPSPAPWLASGRERTQSLTAGVGEVAPQCGRKLGGRRAPPPKANPLLSLPGP